MSAVATFQAGLTNRNRSFALSTGGVLIPTNDGRTNFISYSSVDHKHTVDITNGTQAKNTGDPVVQRRRYEGTKDISGLRTQIIANMGFIDGVRYAENTQEWVELGAGTVEIMQIATLGEYPNIFALIYTGTAYVRGVGEKATSTVGALENMLKKTETWVGMKYNGRAATIDIVLGLRPPPNSPVTPPPTKPPTNPPANSRSTPSAPTSKPLKYCATGAPPRSNVDPKTSKDLNTMQAKKYANLANDPLEFQFGSRFVHNPNFVSAFAANRVRYDNYTGYGEGYDASACFNPYFESDAHLYITDGGMVFRHKATAPPAPPKFKVDPHLW